MIIQDLHIHSRFSDGKNTLEEMVEVALLCNIKHICFTDHVRKESQWVNSYVDEIKLLKKKYQKQIEITIGVEAKVIDFLGNIDCPESVLNDDSIEKVAAIHRIPLGNGKYLRRNEVVWNMDLAQTSWLNAVEGLQKNSKISRFAHPFSLFTALQIQRDDTVWWNKVTELLLKFHGNIEYNIKYDHTMVPENFWNTFEKRLVYGSDSHSVNELSQRTMNCKKMSRDSSLYRILFAEDKTGLVYKA